MDQEDLVVSWRSVLIALVDHSFSVKMMILNGSAPPKSYPVWDSGGRVMMYQQTVEVSLA